MIWLGILVGFWLGAVVGHCIKYARRPFVIRVGFMDTNPAMRDLTTEAFWRITREIAPLRPKIWWMTRPWPKLPHGRPGTRTNDGVYIRVVEKIDFSIDELIAGDPRGKMEAAARLLVEKLKGQKIIGFVDMCLPPGLDFAMTTTDAESGVILQCLRGFDIRENTFITQIEATIVVQMLI